MAWRKHFGHVPTRDRGPLVVATDGSSTPRTKKRMWHTGWGFIGTDGRYGCGYSPQPIELGGRDPALVAELRAVWWAVGERLPTTHITLWLDSRNAADLLESWRAGEVSRMPAGYLGSQAHVPRLVLLAQAVARWPRNLAIEHVAGHSGQLLNEAADSLARIGRTWSASTSDDIAARAHRLAEGFLADPRLREVA